MLKNARRKFSIQEISNAPEWMVFGKISFNFSPYLKEIFILRALKDCWIKSSNSPFLTRRAYRNYQLSTLKSEIISNPWASNWKFLATFCQQFCQFLLVFYTFEPEICKHHRNFKPNVGHFDRNSRLNSKIELLVKKCVLCK